LTIPQEAFVKRLTQKEAPIERFKPTLKRQVGYTQEVVSITRARLAEMEISDVIETNKEVRRESDEEMDENEEYTTRKRR
jgi:hypothetical protein